MPSRIADSVQDCDVYKRMVPTGGDTLPRCLLDEALEPRDEVLSDTEAQQWAANITGIANDPWHR